MTDKTLTDAGAGSEAQAPYDSTYTAGYPVRFAPAADVTLTDPDATFGDDSDFTAGLLATDTGAGDDSGFTHGPVVTDTGTGSDSAVTVAVAAPLAEAGACDDLPWEYLSAGTPVFPYYADLPAAALARVKVGDNFLWYAPS